MDNNVVWVNIRQSEILVKCGEFYWEYKKVRRVVFKLYRVGGDSHLGCGIYSHIKGVKTVGPGNQWKMVNNSKIEVSEK